MIQPAESRILYVFGAGFSAPLGLPVMSNFLSRSKDLYFRDRERFAGFQKVYDAIAELSGIKTRFAPTCTTSRRFFRSWKWKPS